MATRNHDVEPVDMGLMAPLGSNYPAVLQAVINHAQRLRRYLEDRERRVYPGDPGSEWLIGRDGEIQCVVALTAMDWHHDRITGEEAATKLSQYLRELHDGMAMHLDIASPPCCRVPLGRGRLAEDPRRRSA